MITEALQHCHGIGPARLQRLHESGVRTWHDALRFPERLPGSFRDGMVQECRRCIDALERSDIHYLVTRFAPQDKWRVLAHYGEHASFFDIETMGLECDDPITVIVVWHQGCPHVFLEHENLDDFLELLEDVELLVSFNGSSFDVPRVIDAFHIPVLPCAHLDMRWSCYHRGLHGGLKNIANRIGIERPKDLENADGAMAVQLWSQWQNCRDHAARQKLIRYCTADVLLLVLLADRLFGAARLSTNEVWSHLPPVVDSASTELNPATRQTSSTNVELSFGPGTPDRPRTLGVRIAI